MTEDIILVRKRLDAMVNTRPQAPLDPGLESAYLELCALERELLGASLLLQPN